MIFFKIITTKQKFRTETHNIKKRKWSIKSIVYQQTQITDRNSSKKKQWRHRATIKQKKKQLQEVLMYQQAL